LLDLFNCFSLGNPIRRARLERAVGTSNAAFLASVGFVRDSGDMVTSLVRVYLWGGRAFFHDAPDSGFPLQRRTYMGRDSLRFADYLASELTTGRRFQRSLDLGTGCGVQAHVLATVSERVIAVDANERALAFAAANSALNGVDNIELRHSDLTERVTGRFDLIVSNPPFLYLPGPSPYGRDPASDGGLLGIGMSRRILASLAEHLTPGGEARILLSLPRTARGPIMERWIERRVLPQGLDVRLRFVEYLWRDDQYDAYRARRIKTSALVVAEVHRSRRPRLRATRPPVAERSILVRKIIGTKVSRARRSIGAFGRAAHPERLGRALALTAACATRATRVPAPPHQLIIEPTTACPLDCVSCARAERVTEERHMDPEELGRALDMARPWSVQFLGNGDPLAHPEADRLCEVARRRCRQVVLHTALPGESMLPRAERALPHLDQLYIGIDAVDSDTYSAIRRGGDFESLLSMIRRLYHARQGYNRPTIVFTYLLLERNYRDAPAFVRLAYRAGADALLFLPLDLHTIEKRAPDLIGVLNADTLRTCLEQARNTAATIGMRTNLDSLLSSDQLLRSRYDGKPPQGGGHCVRPWLYAYVTVHGDVLPCPRYAYDSGENMGNLFRQPFLGDIWNGDAYRQLRTDLRTRRPLLEHCRDCPVPGEEGGLLSRLQRRRKVP